MTEASVRRLLLLAAAAVLAPAVAQALNLSRGPGFSTGRYQATLTALPDGRILVAGGVDGTGSPLASAEIYNPIARTWSAAAPMGTMRTRHTATLLKTGQVLVIGGFDGIAALSTCELYNPETNSWSATNAPLAVARYRHSATFRPGDGTVVVAGGFNETQGPLKATEIYDPETKSFSAGGNLTTQRYDHSAVLLPNGSILAAGGVSTALGAVTKTAETFLGSSWSPANDMVNAHAGATATLRPNGSVYVVGGYVNAAGDSTAEVDVYDGANWTSPAAGDLPFPRKHHAAGLLPDGTLIVAGGFGSNFSLAFSTDPTRGSGAAVSGTLNFSPNCTQTTGPPCPPPTISVSASPLVAQFSNLKTNPSFSGALLVATMYLSGAALRTTSTTLTGITSSVGELAPNVTVNDGLFSSGVNLAITAGSVATDTYPVLSPLDLAGSRFTVANGTVTIAQAVYSDAVQFDGSSWIPVKGNLDTPQFYLTGILTAGGQFLVGGGLDNNGRVVSSVAQTPLRHGPFTGVTTANTQRQYHSATLLPDGKVLLAGGSSDDGSTVLDTAALSDAPNPVSGDISAFSATGSMNCPRRNHTATLLQDGKVLVCGGLTTKSDSFCGTRTTLSATGSCELYDAGVWTKWVPMTVARANHTASLLFTGQVLAAGGVDQSFSPLSQAELYDGFLVKWTATTPLGLARSEHTGTLLQDGRVLIAGGRQFEPLGISETFDPVTASWKTARMSKNRYRHTATFLLDGKVLVAGGIDIFGFPLADAEAYNPSGDSWGGVGSLVSRHAGHSGTLLPNGLVLVAGGATLFDQNTATTTVETSEGSGWAAARTASENILTTPRSHHTATLLNNGKLLLVGGWNGSAVNGSFEMGYFSEYALGSNAYAPKISDVSGVTPSSGTPPGSLITVTGTNFTGVSEGGGGMNYANGGANYPRVLLRPLDSGNAGTQAGSSFIVDAGSTIYKNPWSNTSLKFRAPLGRGYFQVAVQAAGMTSFFKTLLINPFDVPSAVPTITGTALGVSSVSWTWTSVPFSSSYDVLRASDLQLLASIGVQSYIETGLSPNSPATRIRVRGKSANGTAALSEASPVVYTRAKVPGRPSVVYATAKAVKVSWDVNGNPGGTQYKVQIAKNLGYDEGLVEATTTATSLRLGPTAASTSFYARVQAINADGVASDFSASTDTLTSIGDIIDVNVSRGLNNAYSTLLNSGRTVSLAIAPETFKDGSELVVEDSTQTLCGPIPAALSLSVSPEGQPERPLLLKLTYLNGDVTGIDPSRLLFMRYDPVSGLCVPLKSAVDSSGRAVSALIDHFSLYQIALSTPAASVGEAKLWPNPLFPNRSGQSFMTIRPLPVGAQVQVFTLRGELVYKTEADATGTAQWPALNRAGAKVASGVYLVLLKTGGTTRVLKAAIER